MEARRTFVWRHGEIYSNDASTKPVGAVRPTSAASSKMDPTVTDTAVDDPSSERGGNMEEHQWLYRAGKQGGVLDSNCGDPSSIPPDGYDELEGKMQMGTSEKTVTTSDCPPSPSTGKKDDCG